MTTKTKKIYSKEEWADIEKNKAYCPAMFTSLYLNPQNRMSSCCVQNEHEFKDLPYIEDDTKPITELLNQEFFTQIRKDALNGIQNPACEHCWKTQRDHIEEQKEYRYGFITQSHNAGTSDKIRQAINDDYTVDYDIAPIEHMDVRFSTLCNLRCRSCSGAFSSSWYPEEVKLNKIAHNPIPKEVYSDPKQWDHGQPTRPADHNLSVENLKPHLAGVDKLYFAGGEPVMMKEHYQMLDYLIENNRTDVRLTYNTNFSILTSTNPDGGTFDVIDYWKQFPHVIIGASLDGSHERGEYIRKNIVWSEVEKNIERLRTECPHVGFYLSPTLSIMNAYNIPDFHKEWVEKGYIGLHDISLNLLYGPDHYNVRNLPLNHKKALTKVYEDHIEWIRWYQDLHGVDANNYGSGITDFDNLISFMNNSEPHAEFARMWWKHFWLDENRKEDFFEIFPEYEDLRHMKGLAAKRFHGAKDTWEETYMDRIITMVSLDEDDRPY